MVLLLNTITTEEARQRYDELFRNYIFPQEKIAIRYLTDPPQALNEFSHLIIGGSSLSAVCGSPWDDAIYACISHFLDHNKAILGICYGHQILARFLGGKNVVRKAPLPQYGFRHISLHDNPLFAGLGDFYAMVAHNDEVIALNDDFRILAADQEGCLQAFQFQNKPVWGVQFHPELDYFAATASWERRRREQPQWQKFYQNCVPSSQIMEQNRLIFRNFRCS